MKRQSRGHIVFLEDMILSIERILTYTKDMTLAQFRTNQMVIDAAIRNFEIMGEAAQKVPEKVKSNHPELPWKQMYGLRNLASHEYFGVDVEMIWKIVTDHLSTNKKDLERILSEERDKLGQGALGL